MGMDGEEKCGRRRREGLPSRASAGPLLLIKGDSFIFEGGSDSLTGRTELGDDKHGALPRAVVCKAYSLGTM